MVCQETSARKRSSLNRRLPTLWLLANCAIIALWPGSLMSLFPLGCCAMLLWPIAGLTVLTMAASQPCSVRRRLPAITAVLAGGVIGVLSPIIGPAFHVWWRQTEYLEVARAALANPSQPLEFVHAWIEVDEADTPPIRVAFFWFAAHGDVDGLVYDPTGLVTSGPQQWLNGAHAWHMFGPWYRFWG
ncbi:MAG: hypothetical protein ACI89X_002032 [Planctomycetota bacterium]|jgi:hypothetical protein